MTNKSEEKYCYVCGRPGSQVTLLGAGPFGYICTDCANQLREITDALDNSAKKSALESAAAESAKGFTLLKPDNSLSGPICYWPGRRQEIYLRSGL